MSHELPQRPRQKVSTDVFTHDNADYIVTFDCYSDFYELDKLINTPAMIVNKAT